MTLVALLIELSSTRMTSNSIELSRRLHEKPMLIAVSTLSPVRTQSLIPASLRRAMDSGTPSCNLSSMAVPPMSVKLRSKASATSSIFSSRLTIAAAASS
ncbi:hypothetical protein AWJ20_795 [Sugiyamaella lignohabitans]|uniref:Uncharacterized protein n=1 Tax=Sugiyamaella lignohabitans TaxID=796027 RepID=A0A167D6D7_9ASCO|nr:uncharacterized protein AWJ20_795 [Sugiyamaella lignohabitans]ANB12539.1 hypothetical protein AWJ20_795 [Sugiyamaella lignohabitans]